MERSTQRDAYTRSCQRPHRKKKPPRSSTLERDILSRQFPAKRVIEIDFRFPLDSTRSQTLDGNPVVLLTAQGTGGASSPQPNKEHPSHLSQRTSTERKKGLVGDPYNLSRPSVLEGLDHPLVAADVERF